VVFEDGLGTRHHTLDATAQPLEILTLRPELTAVPSFEFALRERVSRLAGFRHPSFGQVRSVERLDRGATLALISDHVPGIRLSEILAFAGKELLPLDIDAGLCLLRQLVEAVAMLHDALPDVCHGAIAPERIIVTTNARLVLVEHALGAALAQLQYPRERYWQALRIAVPPRAGAPRLDRRADITQVGVVALELLLGRPLAGDEYPDRLEEIAGRVGAVSAQGGLDPLPAPLAAWLARALQFDPRHAFASAVDARVDLDVALAETGYSASSDALEAFLMQYCACVAERRIPSRPARTTVSAEPAPSAAAPKPAGASSPLFSSFGSPDSSPELPAEAAMPKKPTASRRRLVAAAVVLALVAAGGEAARRYLIPALAADAAGTLVVNTNPVGVAIVVDGQARGTTPLSLRLPPGPHVLELVADGDRRSIPITMAAGAQVSQFIEMPRAPSRLGELHVRTEPSGARVTVDGQFHGTAPLTINDLAPGVHVVVLENELGSLQEQVTIEAGTAASLVVPMNAPQGAPVSGWISVATPVEVQLYENQHLLGSSRTARIMVPVGRHELEIVNEAIGYRATRTVTVSPGQVSGIRLEMPKGLISINALPWAEVFIDGQRIGETPLGDLPIAIGPHEIVFRHPELGEHRQSVTVTTNAPARVSLDLRRPR